jgi:hypothetical protein
MAIGRPLNLTPNVATKNISSIATSGQTQFTVTGGYRVNEIGVYRNGTRLVDGRDFTATDGSIVTLLSGATVGDVLEFAVFDSFNIAGVVNTSGDSTINGDLTVTGTVTGAAIGIQSAGTVVGAAKTLNFVGTGNTFAMNGDTVDISIAGGGGGGLGTAINYSDNTASPFSYIDRSVTVSEDMLLDATNAGASDSIIVSVIPEISVASGIAVTVGAGKTMIIDVLEIGDL